MSASCFESATLQTSRGASGLFHLAATRMLAHTMTKARRRVSLGAMRLHQLKVEFDAEQDRLVMHVSTASSEEAVLWITRRCVLRLWELLAGYVQSNPQIAARAADPIVQR